MKMIDAFNHILPPAYFARLQEENVFLPLGNVVLLKDMNARAAEMDTHGDLQQVLTLVMPEALSDIPMASANALMSVANDEMAATVAADPKHFVAGMATLNLRDMDASMRELRRAVEELGLKGVQLPTTIAGESLSEEKYLPFFEAMAAYDLPVFIHPCNGPNSKPDFVFNWPLETTWMMINLSMAGIFQRFPNLKLVTHHLGAMVPTFHNRVYTTYLREGLYPEGAAKVDAETAHENLKKFYGDTALYGISTSAIQAGVDYFGADHVLFGTDYPLDGYRGPDGFGQTANTITGIEGLNISDEDKAKIFSGNILRLLNM